MVAKKKHDKKDKHEKHEKHDDFSTLDSFDDGFGALPHREDDDPQDSVQNANDPFAPDYSDDHPFAHSSGSGRLYSDDEQDHGGELPTLDDADFGRSASHNHTGALSSDFDERLDEAFGKAGEERLASDDEWFDAEEKAWNSPRDQYSSMEEERLLTESLRKRKRMIRIIVVLAVIVAICTIAILVVSHRNATSATSSKQQSITVTNDQSSNSSTVAKATIPNLVNLFGKTTDEVLETLGSQASLGSAESDSESQGIMIKFAPNENTSTSETSSAKLYLIEDSSGKVIETNYSVTLDDLGYTNDSFSSTIADTAFIEKTLKTAGASVSNLTLQQPDASSYQTMGTNASGTEYVQKEEYSFSGSTNLTTPSKWSLKFTFDHSVSASTKSSKSLTRVMSIDLS